MTTLKHTIGLINLNSVEDVIDKLNSLPYTNVSIIDKTISSVTISISIDCDVTLDEVLSLGTLIGSIQTSSLI